MGSLLEGQHALHSKLLKSLLLATCTFTSAATTAEEQSKQDDLASTKPLHRESKMVVVDWQSTPSEMQNKSVRRSVTKPVVEEPVEHTVYQSPSVYLESPQSRAASNPIFDGFKQAGQNLSQATGQTLRDLGTGTKDVAQGIYDGTADTLGAGARAIDNTIDNTFHMGNQEYFNQRAQQNNSTTSRPDLPPPPVNRQTAAYDTDLNNQGFATTQATNGQSYNDQYNNTQNGNVQNNNQAPNNNNQQSSQQQYAQQQGNQQLNEIPAVPRQPLDTGISTNFGNSQSNRNFGVDDSRMAPVQDQRGQNYSNNGYDTRGYANQNLYQNNPTPSYQNQNQSRGYNQGPNLITPPAADQYAAGQVPAWTTPSFNQVSGNPVGNQVSGPTTQQTSRPISTPASQWPAQQVSTTGWGESQGTNLPANQTANTQIAQTGLNDNNDREGITPELVWLLTGFSIFGNVYGWTALLDMRNKYRASLRRNPVNLRDGGH